MTSRTAWKPALLFSLAAVVSLANTITGVTGDPTSPAPFSIVGISNENQKANEVGGMLATATFGDGGPSVSCTFANDSNSCTSAGNFTLTLSPATQNTSAATWEIYNLRTGTAGTTDNMVSITIDGRFAGNGIGGGQATVFNPCVTSVGPPLVFKTNGGCAGAGSGNGSTIQTTSGGITGVTAAAIYGNAVMIAPATVAGGEMWFRVTLSFAGSATAFEGQGSTGGTPFTFVADTDMVDIPEPGTYGLVGLALAGLGAIRLRRKS